MAHPVVTWTRMDATGNDLGSHGWFERLVASITDYAMFMLAPSGIVLTWNPGAERTYGYPAGEVIGKHFSVFYPARQIATGWPTYELEQAQLAGRFEDEGWRLRADGTPFWANVVITALRDEAGALLGYGKITRDLTERRRQENALRQSEERFRLLVESVKDYAIFMLDRDGRVVSWNRGAETIKGYKASEIIGRHFSVFYPQEAIARHWPENELQMAREYGRFEDEGWRLRKDGTAFWANVIITAVYDDQGVLRGFAKITRDLTTHKRYEEMQRNQRQTNNFLAMLAHELRNPLDPIRHALDLMALQPADAGTRDWARDVIDRQVMQLGRLVDDLLDVSRITSGKINLKLEPTNLEQIVAEIVESVRPLASARQQVIETRVEGASFECRVDRTRVAQIVLNLLTNAVKYTPTGGRITVTVLRLNAFGEVRVVDTGMGMSQELVEHVFDPFVQGERTLDRADGGLGLGLTLVRRLAEMHGGSVSAQSEGEGKGSTFTVRFPICATAPAGDLQISAAGQHVAPSSQQRRVLIVDDNLDAANTLGALVTALGHQVWTVHDGPAAVAAATEHKPDTVLLDIGLPGMSGYDVVKELRAVPGLRESTMVACTGYGHDSDRLAVREAGFDGHLVKPIEIARLQEILRRPTARSEAPPAANLGAPDTPH